MDRMKRLKSWKAFESAQGKQAIDAVGEAIDALQDVYMLCIETIDKGGELCAMVTIDDVESGGDEYIFSQRFDSQNRPEDYTPSLNNIERIQRSVDEGYDITVGVCLTMIDEDDMEVMDIEATYLLEESMDELNRIRPGIRVRTMGPYDYQENFDYF